MKRVGQIGMVLLVLALGLWARPAGAQTAPQQPFTLAPGGTATITFEAYCTEFGKFFPQTGVKEPSGVAPDNVRAALAYIQQKGYSADPARALESQYAIWQLLGAARAPQGGATTQEVVGAATTAPANPQGTSLVDAAKAGQVRISVTEWQPIGEKVQILSATDNFYGRGTLTVENTSQESLNLYMPIGTLLPAVDARSQTMGGYATNVQIQNQATPTTVATTAPTVAATAAATAAPTAAAATVAPTRAAGQLPSTSGSGGSPELLLFAALGLLGLGLLAGGARRLRSR